MIQNVKERYGNTFEDLRAFLNMNPDITLHSTEHGGVVYFKCPDFETKEVGIFPLMDNILPYDDLIVGSDLGGGVIVREHGLPKAVVSLKGLDSLDSWIDTIKVPNSIKRGAKYSEIGTMHTSYTVNDLESFKNLLEMFKGLFALKEDQYSLLPNTLYNSYVAEFLALSCHGISIVEIHELSGYVTDVDLFNWVGFKLSNGVMYAPFMYLTQDEGLKKSHKPGIVAHIAMTKHALLQGCTKADYGHYYEYKKILNFELEWVKGLLQT